MAHSGKTYPVHFRRDFNLDVKNNSLGYAKGYAWFSGEAFGDIGVVLYTMRILLIASQEATFNGLLWLSEGFRAAGHDLAVDMRTTESDGFPMFAMKGDLVDSGLGILGSFQSFRIPGQHYDSLGFNWTQESITHPELFLPTFNTASGCGAIRWAEWNNL